MTQCHAPKCDRASVKPGLFCNDHWFQVPAIMRVEIQKWFNLNVSNQSTQYFAAANHAIKHLRNIERCQTPASV